MQEQWYKFSWINTFDDKDAVPKTIRKARTTHKPDADASGIPSDQPKTERVESSELHGGGACGTEIHDQTSSRASNQCFDYPVTDLRRWRVPGSAWDRPKQIAKYASNAEHSRASRDESTYSIPIPKCPTQAVVVAHEHGPHDTRDGDGTNAPLKELNSEMRSHKSHIPDRVPTPKKQRTTNSNPMPPVLGYRNDSFVPKATKAFHSIGEAMQFYDSFLDEVIQRDDNDDGSSFFDPATCTLNQLADWLEETTHSSAFSGVAAPETGLLGLHRAVQDRMPDRKASWGFGG